MRRLTCAAALICCLSSGAAAQSWVYVEETDPITDQLQQFAYGFADGFPVDPASPYIRLGCYDQGADYPTGLTLHWGTPLAEQFPDGDFRMAAVTLRVGSETPRTLGWDLSADHRMTYAPNPFSGFAELGQAFVDGLLGRDAEFLTQWQNEDIHRIFYADARVAMRARGINGQDVTLIFEPDGFYDAVAAFRDHCIPAEARNLMALMALGDTAQPSEMPPETPADHRAFGEFTAPYSGDFDLARSDAYVLTPAAQAFLDDLFASQAPLFPFASENAAVIRLPFYADAHLIYAVDPDRNIVRAYLVDIGRARIEQLDGTATPIHRFNTVQDGLILTPDIAPAYFWTFGLFVHAPGGAFHVVDDTGDNLRIAPSDPDRQVFASQSQPPDCGPMTGDGVICTVHLLYDGDLYRSEVLIRDTGMIEMTADTLVAPLDSLQFPPRQFR